MYKLPPPHPLILQDAKLTFEPYWDISFRCALGDKATCVGMLADLIRDAVRLRLVSDVPLGAFLRGHFEKNWDDVR
jgi:asparagine synthase (glutamine-hydrolysing)